MAVPDAPDFIKFLFSEKPTFDCFFIVGDKNLMEPERIGAVRMMLMAHSVVFRSELGDSDLREKDVIAVKDIYPDTFRALLKFIYGYDITGDLEFDDANNLFHAAEKYIMTNLKNKLALRLIDLLTPDNISSLLNNPACNSQLQLNAHIRKILRYETDRVLASPQFLDNCTTEGFLMILQQDGLAVPEIELWKAALKWAKHRGKSENGEVLRQELSKVLKHLKLCTCSAEQFCKEVVPACVLNNDEVVNICQSIGTKTKIDDLTELCNETVPRKRLIKRVKSEPLSVLGSDIRETHELNLFQHEKNKPNLFTFEANKPNLFQLENPDNYDKLFVFNILTKWNAVELLPLNLKFVDRGLVGLTDWKLDFECTVEITELTTPDTFGSFPLTATFIKKVVFGDVVQVPLGGEGCNVILLPKRKYLIKLSTKQQTFTYYGHGSNTNRHIEVSTEQRKRNSPMYPTECLKYKLADGEYM